jgi:N-acyl homoserine lactone hydrolase
MQPQVEIFALMGGMIKTRKNCINRIEDPQEGERPFTVPVPFYVIKHGTSYVVYDTGMNKKCVTREGAIEVWGKDIVDAFLPVMSEADYIEAQLQSKLGIKPQDVNAVIQSHGHMDHAGGLPAFAGTEVPVYIQKTELEAIKRLDFAYIEEEFQDIDWMPIDGLLDLYGDGTVIIMPMPGHTLGLQCVMVKTEAGYCFLAGDAVDNMNQLEGRYVTARCADDAKRAQSVRTLNLFRAMGIEVVPEHDLAYWKNRPLAPLSFM